MANKETLQYLTALNNMRNNKARGGYQIVDPSDDSVNAGADISSFAYLNTPVNSYVDTKTNNQEKSNNIWARINETIGEFSTNVNAGVLNFIDGLWDFTLNVDAMQKSFLGFEDSAQQARDMMNYDWVTPTAQVMSDLQNGGMANGFFTQSGANMWESSYWEDLGARNQQQRLNSYSSELGENQKWVTNIEQGVGNVLPSIAIGVATGGLGLAPAAAKALSLAPTVISAAGNTASEKVQEGANDFQAFQSGLISGGIEAATEYMIPGGSGVNGVKFSEISKLTLKELGKSALEEGTEEVLSEILSPLSDLPIKGKDEVIKDLFNWTPEEMEQMGMSFVGGAVGGALGSGIQNGALKSIYTSDGIDFIENASNADSYREAAQREVQKGSKGSQEKVNEYIKKSQDCAVNALKSLDKVKSKNPTAFENIIKTYNGGADFDSLKQQIKDKFENLNDKQLRQEVFSDMVRTISSGDYTYKIEDRPEFNQVKDSKAFILNGNEIYINPKYEGEFNKLIAHEGFSHAFIDSNKKEFTKLQDNLKSIMGDDFTKYDNKIVKAYGKEVELTGNETEDQLKSYKKIDGKYYEIDDATFQSERMARVMEDILGNENDKVLRSLFKTQDRTSLVSSLKGVIEKVKRSLSTSKESEISKAIDKAINEIKFAEEIQENIFGKLETNNYATFSIATYENGGKEALIKGLKENGYSQEEIDATIDEMDGIVEKIKAYAKESGYKTLLEYINKKADISIRNGKPVFSALTPNGDYVINFDLSATCKKKVAYQSVIEKLATAGVFNDRGLSPSEIAKIHNILRDHGIETPCTNCFVESRRLYQFAWANSAIKMWNNAVRELYKGSTDEEIGYFTDVPDEIIIEEGNIVDEMYKKVRGQKDTDTIVIPSKKSNNNETENVKENKNKNKKYLDENGEELSEEEAQIIKDKEKNEKENPRKVRELVKQYKEKFGEVRLLTTADLITSKGLVRVRAQYKEFFSMLQSSYGAGTPKMNRGFVPYSNELLRLNAEFSNVVNNKTIGGFTALVSKLRKQGMSKSQAETEALRRITFNIGGVRYQSFSDFRIEQVFDVLQFVKDLKARRLPAHLYTKEMGLIKILGLSGVKMNGSLISQFYSETDNNDLSGLREVTSDNPSNNGITIKLQVDEKGNLVKENGNVVILDNNDTTTLSKTYTTDFITSDDFKNAVATNNYRDKNGNPMQSIPFDEALKYMGYERNGNVYTFNKNSTTNYSNNFGTIAIAFSYAHAVALMNSPYISMVIPYHASGMVKEFSKMYHFDKALDWTKKQETKITEIIVKDSKGNVVTDSETITKVKKKVLSVEHFNWNEELRKAYDELKGTSKENDAPKIVAKRYADKCYKGVNEKEYITGKGKTTAKYIVTAKFTPKFAELSNSDNYYKVLTDFSLYDSSGKLHMQEAVNGKLPSNVGDIIVKQLDVARQISEHDAKESKFVIKDILKDVFGYNESEIEKISSKINKNDYKYSKSLDSDGNKLTEQQEKYFEKSTDRDDNGNLIVDTHVTNNQNFYVFDQQRQGENSKEFSQGGALGKGFYFSGNDPDMNKRWKQWLQMKNEGKKTRTLKVYLNITKPLHYSQMTLNDDVKQYVVNNLTDENNVEYFEKVKNNAELFEQMKWWDIDIQDTLKSLGYDGIVEGEHQKVVFDSNQIKLIDNKTPTNDPDIRYSKELNDAKGKQKQYSSKEIQSIVDKVSSSINEKLNNIFVNGDIKVSSSKVKNVTAKLNKGDLNGAVDDIIKYLNNIKINDDLVEDANANYKKLKLGDYLHLENYKQDIIKGIKESGAENIVTILNKKIDMLERQVVSGKHKIAEQNAKLNKARVYNPTNAREMFESTVVQINSMLPEDSHLDLTYETKERVYKNGKKAQIHNRKFLSLSEQVYEKMNMEQAGEEAKSILESLLELDVVNGKEDETFKLGSILTEDQKQDIVNQMQKYLNNNGFNGRVFALSMAYLQEQLSKKDALYLARQVRSYDRLKKSIPQTMDTNLDYTGDNVAYHEEELLTQDFTKLESKNGLLIRGNLKERLKTLLDKYTKDNWKSTISEDFDKTDLNIDYDEVLADKLKEVYDTLQNDDGYLTGTELGKINQYLRMVKHLMNSKKKTNADALKIAIGTKNQLSENGGKGAKGFIYKVIHALPSANSMIEYIFGARSQFYKLSVTDMERANGKKKLEVGKFVSALNDKIKELKFNPNDKIKVNGITISKDEAIYIYGSLKTQENFDKINESSMVIFVKDKIGSNETKKTIIEKGKAQETLDYLEKNLTENDKKMTEYIKDQYNGDLQKEYKQWFKETYGQDTNEVEDYFPLFRHYSKPSMSEVIVSAPAMFKRQITRKENRNEVMVKKSTSAIVQYRESLSIEKHVKPVYKKSYATLGTKYNGTKGRTNLYETLEKEYGTNVINYVKSTLDGNVGLVQSSDAVLGKLMSQMSVATLGLKLTTMVKQYASLFTSNIKASARVKAMFNRTIGNIDGKFGKEMNKIIQENGHLAFRSDEVVKGNIPSKLGRGTEKIAMVTMAGTKFVDKQTVFTGVAALMTIGETQFNAPIGSQANRDFVNEHLPDFVLTQIGSGANNQNAISRGDYGSFIKLVFGVMQGANRAIAGSMLTKALMWKKYHSLTKDQVNASIEEAKANLGSNAEELEKLNKQLEKEKATLVEMKEELKKNKSTMDEEEIASFKNEIEAQKTAIDDVNEQINDVEFKASEINSIISQGELDLRNIQAYQIMGGGTIPVQMVGGLMVSAIFLSMINQIGKWIRGKKKWGEFDKDEIIIDILSNALFNWIPAVNTILSNLTNKMAKNTEYDLSDSAAGMINELMELAYDGIDMVKGQGNVNAFTQQVASVLANVTGLNAKTILEYIEGGTRLVSYDEYKKVHNIFYGATEQSEKTTLNNLVKTGSRAETIEQIQYIMDNYSTGRPSYVVANEIYNLKKKGYSTMPKSIPTSYTNENGENVQLTAKEKKAFIKAYSMANKDIEKMIKNALYRKLTEEEKAKAISKLYNSYYYYSLSKATGIETSNKYASYVGSNDLITQIVNNVKESSK